VFYPSAGRRPRRPAILRRSIASSGRRSDEPRRGARIFVAHRRGSQVPSGGSQPRRHAKAPASTPAGVSRSCSPHAGYAQSPASSGGHDPRGREPVTPGPATSFNPRRQHPCL